jgi:hypothetical protein
MKRILLVNGQFYKSTLKKESFLRNKIKSISVLLWVFKKIKQKAMYIFQILSIFQIIFGKTKEFLKLWFLYEIFPICCTIQMQGSLSV